MKLDLSDIDWQPSKRSTPQPNLARTGSHTQSASRSQL